MEPEPFCLLGRPAEVGTPVQKIVDEPASHGLLATDCCPVRGFIDLGERHGRVADRPHDGQSHVAQPGGVARFAGAG
jgi:hypothetical protein